MGRKSLWPRFFFFWVGRPSQTPGSLIAPLTQTDREWQGEGRVDFKRFAAYKNIPFDVVDARESDRCLMIMMMMMIIAQTRHENGKFGVEIFRTKALIKAMRLQTQTIQFSKY